jgi:hypothetical protein
MARKRRTRNVEPAHLTEDLPDFWTLLSCPFITEETRLDMCRQLQKIFGDTPEPDVAEPMPKTPDSGDVFRAHALGIRLDGKWSQPMQARPF